MFIKNGQVQYATLGGEMSVKPMKAICRMVTWETGTFRLEPYEDGEEFPETFEESTESILMEALRQHDEMRRLMGQMPAVESLLALCVPLTPKLSDLDPNELDTLQLVLNFNTFKAVIDKQIRAVTASVGRAHGFDYAEGFRVSRFGAIPRLAKGQELEEDV